MNPSFRTGLLTGFLAGAALAGSVVVLLRRAPAPEAPRSVPPGPAGTDERLSGLQEENRRLGREVAQLKSPAPPPPPAPAPGADKDSPKPPDLKERFAKLAELGFAALQSGEMGKLVAFVKESGRPATEFLAGVLRSSASAQERFLAAALLEGAGDPSSVPALAEALQGDRDDLVRRMASHALAVLGAPEGEEPLRAASQGDADWGVRVNSAYGLAKLQRDDGLRLLVGAYEAADTPAEYRLAILGGLMDVAAPSTAPLFRRILSDSKDAGYLLLAIQALGKMRDAEALTVLQQVSSSTQPDLIKQAAAKAVESIQKGSGR